MYFSKNEKDEMENMSGMPSLSIFILVNFYVS